MPRASNPIRASASLLVAGAAFSLAMCFLLPSCTTEGFRQAADDEVYAILDQKSSAVFGEARPIVVDAPTGTLRERLLLEQNPLLKITLLEALDIAAENSREFQRRKETLYLAALALTRQRWDFSVKFDGGNVTSASGVGDDSSSGRTVTDLSAARLLSTGGSIIASFVNTFVRSFTTGTQGGWNGSSILGMALTQPLLRGFGQRVTMEPLTQAERSVVYEVRNFERFRRELAVTVVSDYYGVLTQMDATENASANLVSVSKTAERNEELFRAGRLTQVQLDQSGQSKFTAEDRAVRAENNLETIRDRLKLTLGLPPTIRLELDRTEFQKLQALGVIPLEAEPDHLLRLALTRRLDLRNTVEQVEDTKRKIVVAEDALRMGLDFSAGVDVPTEPDKPLKFDWDKVQWTVGVALDLGLERLPERNAYRTTLINHQAAVRRLEEHQDQIKQQIRLSIRRLSESMNTHRIQAQAKTLAERRVDSARALLEAGIGNVQVRDVLDAQDSLLQAQNAETSALVNYFITRLELLRDIEALILGPEGLVYDPSLTIPKEIEVEKQ